MLLQYYVVRVLCCCVVMLLQCYVIRVVCCYVTMLLQCYVIRALCCCVIMLSGYYTIAILQQSLFYIHADYQYITIRFFIKSAYHSRNPVSSQCLRCSVLYFYGQRSIGIQKTKPGYSFLQIVQKTKRDINH